jgi:hypothetical protein
LASALDKVELSSRPAVAGFDVLRVGEDGGLLLFGRDYERDVRRSVREREASVVTSLTSKM